MSRVLVRAPPKSVFQLLLDPTLLEEYTKWRVDAKEEARLGAQWTERKGLRRRTWRITQFDRRGLQFTQSMGELNVQFTAKKGGPGSTNLCMDLTGPAPVVARFERTDGDRLEQLARWLESD